MTQYFSGKATVVNAGTLKALEGKGAAKKPTRPAVPQNSALLQKNDGRRNALLGSILELEAHLGLVWCVQKVYFWMVCSVFCESLLSKSPYHPLANQRFRGAFCQLLKVHFAPNG